MTLGSDFGIGRVFLEVPLSKYLPYKFGTEIKAVMCH